MRTFNNIRLPNMSQEQTLRAAREAIGSPKGFAAEGDRTMKWGRDYDYHGSRNYDANAPLTGRFSLMFHWIANVVHNRTRKLTGRGSPTAFLLFDGKHNFSVLGASAKHRSPGRQVVLP
jgi:hypothetical protein